MKKLQHVQNTAARIVTYTSRQDHITPILSELHWLPVQYRIIYKILLFTYKALNDLAPSYIRDLITDYVPLRSSLRSSNMNYLVQPRSNFVKCGDRSFAVAAPKLWNSLPLCIRNASNLHAFKSMLKTHLYKEAFSC